MKYILIIKAFSWSPVTVPLSAPHLGLWKGKRARAPPPHATLLLVSRFYNKINLLLNILEVSTGRGRMRAGPGRAWAEVLNCGPGLTWAGRAGPGRADRFYNLLGIRAGFLQSFTCTNFLTLHVRKTIWKFLKFSSNFLKILLNFVKFS